MTFAKAFILKRHMIYGYFIIISVPFKKKKRLERVRQKVGVQLAPETGNFKTKAL